MTNRFEDFDSLARVSPSHFTAADGPGDDREIDDPPVDGDDEDDEDGDDDEDDEDDDDDDDEDDDEDEDEDEDK